MCFELFRYYAKLHKLEEEREKELASKYRDRVCLFCDVYCALKTAGGTNRMIACKDYMQHYNY